MLGYVCFCFELYSAILFFRALGLFHHHLLAIDDVDALHAVVHLYSFSAKGVDAMCGGLCLGGRECRDACGIVVAQDADGEWFGRNGDGVFVKKISSLFSSCFILCSPFFLFTLHRLTRRNNV